jgi:hypothetical protein
MDLGQIIARRKQRKGGEDLRKLTRLLAATSARGRANGLLRALELATVEGWPADIHAALEAEARTAEATAREAEERSNIR